MVKTDLVATIKLGLTLLAYKTKLSYLLKNVFIL